MVVKKHSQTYIKPFDREGLNRDLPLQLKSLQKIVATIHHQFPQMKKSEISLIIKTFLEEIREQLVLGNKINVRGFLYDMRLYTYARLRNEKVIFTTRVQVATPYAMRKE